MKIYEGHTCPWCGHSIEGQTEIEYAQHKPQNGDFSICSECRKVAVFTNDGAGFRKATEVEIADLFVRQPDALDRFKAADVLLDRQEE